MNPTTPTGRWLAGLPGPERREEVGKLVETEFRAALLMTDNEELPRDENYFDLGLTSLRAAEIKQRLEERLGRAIGVSVLLASPTVDRLAAQLAELLSPRPTGTASDAFTERGAAVHEVLTDLYES